MGELSSKEPNHTMKALLPFVFYQTLIIHFMSLLLVEQPHLLMATTTAQPQTSNELTIGSSMTSTEYLTSSSGTFVFGFCNIDPSTEQLLLAIWFNFGTTTDKTVVWFARDSSSNHTVVATEQSILKFADSGRVSLIDGRSESELWQPTQPFGSALVLQDSGNLQLIAKDGVRWESFSDPADTLLPGQNMSNRPGKYLQSRSTARDLSPGRFTLNVQDDGNIVLYMKETEVPTDLGAPYWATTTFGTGKVPTLFFNDSGNLYYSFSGNESGAVNLTAMRPLNSLESYYHYAALDPDGTVRVYALQKNNTGSGLWDVVSRFPGDGCSRRTNFGLQGMCGPNGYCTVHSKDKEERLDCECPYGYVFVDEQHRYRGCRPSFVPDSCDGRDKNSSDEFMTVQMPYTSWSNQSTYKKFMLTSTTTLEHCNSSCLNDCFCAAILVDATSCMFVGMLTAGKVTQDTSMTLIKVRINTTIPGMFPPDPAAPRRSMWLYITIGTAILLGSSIMYIIRQWYSSNKAKRKLLGLRAFSSKELKRATKNFKKAPLGKGSFGEVYRGELSHGQVVAVKKLTGPKEYNEKDFENEVRSIGQIHHSNLVRMIGYCKEEEHRMLVFEYMPGGTLADFIFGSKRPPWNLLVKAAIGIAKGLEYLDEGCQPKIIHCDIKPDNILFDDKRVPKITDFGIAKLLGDQKTQQKFKTNTIIGTKPYIAPEWFRDGTSVNSKVDVYSFGVVLLEMIRCKRATEEDLPPPLPPPPPLDQDPNTMFWLRSWAESLLGSERAEEMVQGDNALDDMKSVKRFAQVAMWCLQKDPSMRPWMRRVVQMLEGIVEVDPLPDPPRPPSVSPMLPTSNEIDHSSSRVDTSIQIE